MKIIEKPWKYGTYLAYDDVEPELAEVKFGDRVLPAPFFYEKKLFFWLIKRYEPGEKETFPNGGYEVRDEAMAIRSYDLDQVILHPAIIKHKKTLDKMVRRAEKEQRKRERKRDKVQKVVSAAGGRRGRPALDPAEKARRAESKIESAVKSGGKRGRPKSTEPKLVNTQVAPKGKRGRPALSTEELKLKADMKAATTVRSGGKRGRPKRS
jgi:hypothetical protein